MVDLQYAHDDVLGSCRLEHAEPDAEMIAILRRAAAGEITLAQLEVIADRATAGQPLQPAATWAAA